MKKVINILLIICIGFMMFGCQNKTQNVKEITVSISFSDPDGASGGMNGNVEEGSTLKDLFDDLGEGTDFVYELDSEGNIKTINNKANDENGNWEIMVNNEVINGAIDKVVVNDGDNCVISYIKNTANEIVGGWEIAEVGREELTDEERQDFEKALEGNLGEDYEPVCLLATQLVNGTNYAYLARGTTVTATPKNEFVIVKIYKTLQGDVSLSAINSIDVTDIHAREDVDDNIVGGWTVVDTGKPGSLGSEEVQASYEKAMAEVIGVGYNPIQLLARQVVNGTNYIALVRGSVISVEDSPELYIIYWHEDLDGNSAVTDIKKFDLNYYVQ